MYTYTACYIFIYCFRIIYRTCKRNRLSRDLFSINEMAGRREAIQYRRRTVFPYSTTSDDVMLVFFRTDAMAMAVAVANLRRFCRTDLISIFKVIVYQLPFGRVPVRA